MPDILTSAFATPGFEWIVFAAFLSGVVRGFAGFGTAMIFLPIAGQYVSPVAAIALLTVMDAFAPLPMLRRAWSDCNPPDLARLMGGLVLLLPVGLTILLAVQPEVFRYGVSVIALILLTCLVLGFRYRNTIRSWMVYVIGGVSGVLGGAAGVPGPPVILFYMASPLPARSVRANITLFLFGYDLLLLSMLAFRDVLTMPTVVLGLVIAVPGVLGIILGSVIFRPELERTYRIVAYVIIGVSAVSGLPLFD